MIPIKEKHTMELHSFRLKIPAHLMHFQTKVNLELCQKLASLNLRITLAMKCENMYQMKDLQTSFF